MVKTKKHDEDEPCPETWEMIEKKGCLDDAIDLELLKHRTLVLHGELNEELCNRVCKKLVYLDLKKAKEINIVLNSVGGEVYHGLLIFNTLEDLKKKNIKVIIEARGLCASMGVWVLLGGSERTSSKYTRFLLHETSSFTYGKVSEMKEGVQELEKLNLMLDDIIVNRTKISLQRLQQKTRKREWWLSAEEALKYGLIDRIT